MTEKRFVDGGAEAIEEQFLIDTLTNNNYWIDNGLDEIIDMLNQLSDENEQLKQQVEDLEFALQTKLAYQRVEKEEHSDSVYDFKKKLEKW